MALYSVFFIAWESALADPLKAVKYSGKLTDNGGPAHGQYDLQFTVFQEKELGLPVGLPVVLTNQMVSNGVFAAELEFGRGTFDGMRRWLEVAVRTNGSLGPFWPMRPRQEITPVPYALVAREALSALEVPDGAITAAKIGAQTLGIQHLQATMPQPGQILGFDGQGFAWTNAAPLRASGTIMVDGEYGSDTTGTIGDLSKPFASISNALAAATNNCIILVRPGRYVIQPFDFSDSNDSPLKLFGKTNVTLYGLGPVEIYGEGPGDFLTLGRCNNIVIQNITFTGNRPRMFGRSNFSFINFSHITPEIPTVGCKILYCRFINGGGHGISHLDGDKTTRDVEIAYNYFEGIGETNWGGGPDGACISGIGSYWRIHDNYMTNIVRGIEIQNDGPTIVRGVDISRNYAEKVDDAFLMLFASTSSSGFQDIKWVGNVVRGLHRVEPGFGLAADIQGGERLLFEGNQFIDCTFGPTFNAVNHPIKDVVIRGNILRDIGARGFQVFGFGGARGMLSNVLIADNLIENVSDSAILIAGSRISVRGNKISRAAGYGVNGAIEIQNAQVSRECVIEGNEITGGWDYVMRSGVWIRGGISNCIVRFNRTYGAGTNILDDGTGNVVMFNSFAGTNFVPSELWGGSGLNVKTVTTNYAVTDDDDLVLVNATNAVITVPDAGPRLGRRFSVKLIAPSKATITNQVGQTFDGRRSTNLTARYKIISTVSDGRNWQIISSQ